MATFDELVKDGAKLLEVYKVVRTTIVPKDIREALATKWDLEIQGLEIRALKPYDHDQRRMDKQRVIRADKALHLLLDFEQRLVETIIVDEFTILGQQAFALGSVAFQVGRVLVKNAWSLFKLLIASIVAGVIGLAKVLYAFWTQNVGDITASEDATERALTVLSEAAWHAARGVIEVGLKRALQAFALSGYTATVYKGMKVRNEFVQKMRFAALPQRNPKRYRRRKLHNA